MRAFLETDTDFLFLAGDGRLSERVFSSAGDLEVSGAADVEIVEMAWGDFAQPKDRGNLRTQIGFATRRAFDSAAEAEDFAESYTSDMPREGRLILQTGAGSRKIEEAVVAPPEIEVDGSQVLMRYRAAGGEVEITVPDTVVAELDETEGLLHRIVDDGNEKWFEVGFLSPYVPDGNAADGWTDPTGNLLFRLKRSEDLVNWDHDWTDSPLSPEAIGDDWKIWARSIYPVDSKIKSGQIRVSSAYGQAGINGNITPDSRNNPFIALTVAGVSLALGGFPYTMPADAARMQTDIRAFYPTATVVATSNVDWEIIIPGVALTSYTQTSKVFWPGYLVPDMFGNLTITVNGAGFAGEFVNSSGVRTALSRQFARLGVSAGPNYRF